MVRGLLLSLVLFAWADATSRSGSHESPAAFFDDVRAPVSRHPITEGSHAALAEPAKADATSLATAASMMKLAAAIAKTQGHQQDSQAKATHILLPRVNEPEQALVTSHTQLSKAFLSRSSLSQRSGMKPLEGLRKQLVPEREDIDDPRATGFGAQGGRTPPAAQPGDTKAPSMWRLFSLARMGFQSAIKNAMPAWQDNSLGKEGTRTPETEAYDVDRSDLDSPGAASLLSRR